MFLEHQISFCRMHNFYLMTNDLKLFLSSAKALLTFTRTGAIENGKLCSAITPKIRASAFEILSHRGTFLCTGVRLVVVAAAAEDDDGQGKKLFGRE
ncbi:hypothetical protein AVEN_29613-1 [Araneus ventricosus]|uniref:Uncharacterized protein n=1 Tax=Araneus ventricosus TaxID=182803 RepID=A0A4Y2I876_ARAVE|nr:hypothetical protein AVEN_29613-1 [Araneus ventricosus]